MKRKSDKIADRERAYDPPNKKIKGIPTAEISKSPLIKLRGGVSSG
jgi:hypothetical protein